MSSYNSITLMGYLTRDPKLTYTPSGMAVVDFGLATNRKWNAKDGSQRDETCFVDCRAFGRMAENIHKFFKKGRPILLQGRLSFDQWTGPDGVKRSKHRVTVEMFVFPPGESQASVPPAGGNYEDAPWDPREPTFPPQLEKTDGQPRESSPEDGSDIPF